jgi:hypothetical protein
MMSFKSSAILAFYLLAIFLLLRLNTKRALSIFAGYVFTMIFVITFSVSQIFNFVYNTGENEIVNFSAMSFRPDMQAKLVTFDFAVKPSVLVAYNDTVQFITDADFKTLDNLLSYKGGPTFVIIKNKNMKNDAKYRREIEKRLELVQRGERYSLYVKDVRNQFNNEPQFIDNFSSFTFYASKAMLPNKKK